MKKDKIQVVMLSKFDWQCKECGAEIKVGDLIVYLGKKKALCRICGKDYLD